MNAATAHLEASHPSPACHQPDGRVQLDAQLTSAAVIYGASLLGAPVSTTHVVSSSIMGIGTADRARAVRWGKAQEILSTWLITIPGAGIVGVIAYLISMIFTR